MKRGNELVKTNGELMETVKQKNSRGEKLSKTDKVLNKTQRLIEKGNRLADKGEKYIKKLRTVHAFVKALMVISMIFFFISAGICAIIIYRTVQSDEPEVMEEMDTVQK